MVFKKNGALNEDIGSIIYYIWIPQAFIDSSLAAAVEDSSMAGGIQNYLMHTGWDWRSKWVSIHELQGNTWNKLIFKIPDDVENSNIKETGLTFNMQNAGIGEADVFIDDIIYEIPEPPADYDFETAAQFDQWLLENFGSQGGTPLAYYSTEAARSGLYSYKIKGNFVTDSEYALRQNNALESGVTALIYHFWVPQALVDTAAAAFEQDSTNVGIIQNFLMHNGWQWISETTDYKDLAGDNWNRIKLDIPENVDNSLVQSIGLTFKTMNADIGETSVFIDDIYFEKEDEPTLIDNNLLAEVPTDFRLFHNYPNPFNPETKIRFNLPKSVKVKMTVYDIAGRKVKSLLNEDKTAGSYEIIFDGSQLASGIYLYTLEAGNYTDVKKMILLK